MKMFYFGPWSEPGHYLHDKNGISVYKKEDLINFPWSENGHDIDCKLQPHFKGCSGRNYCGCGSVPEGQALIHHKDGWTALSFWDRSVNGRGGCNSTYFAEGIFTFDEMVTFAKERFSYRWNKMQFQVTEFKANKV